MDEKLNPEVNGKKAVSLPVAVTIGVVGIAAGLMLGVSFPTAQKVHEQEKTLMEGTPKTSVVAPTDIVLSEAMIDEGVKQALDQFAASYKAEVVKIFPMYRGMFPFVVTDGNVARTFYLNPDRVVIAGAFMDLDTTEVLIHEPSEVAMQATMKEFNRARFASLEADIESLATLNVKGDTKNELFMFFAADCGYCVINQTDLEKTNATVRYIPVHRGTESSMALAALMLASPAEDPKTIMSKVIAKGSKLEAAVAEGRDYLENQAVRASIESNSRFMSKMGVEGTPFFMWKTSDGEWKTHSGLMQGADLESALRG